MASTRTLSHNPNFAAQICCWQKVGENVGYTTLRDDMESALVVLHDAFMNSPEHRDAIVDPSYEDVGIAVVTGGCPSNETNQCIWVTENFRDKA